MSSNRVVRKVPFGEDLTLHCYTKAAFYKRLWTPTVIKSRGHVYDKHGDIVSNPFDKFFNVNEVHNTKEANLLRIHLENPGSYFEAYEKFNGHLSIVFNHKGQWINTNKGSAGTDMTLNDRVLLDKVCNYNGMRKNHTYMFEVMDTKNDPHVMFPFLERNNRHDVLDTAVLIGVRETVTGRYLDYRTSVFDDEVIIPKSVVFDGRRTFGDMVGFGGYLNMLRRYRNTEGWVVHLKDADDQPLVVFKVKTRFFLFVRHYWYGELKHKAKSLIMDMHNGVPLNCEEEVVPALEAAYNDAKNNIEGLSVEEWLEKQPNFQKYVKYLGFNME